MKVFPARSELAGAKHLSFPSHVFLQDLHSAHYLTTRTVNAMNRSTHPPWSCRRSRGPPLAADVARGQPVAGPRARGERGMKENRAQQEQGRY